MLTPEEVRSAFVRAEQRFVEVCASATRDQWRYRPTSGARLWTMPQVVEHVTSGNEGVLRLLRDVVVKSARGSMTPDFDDEDMPYLFYGGAGPLPPGLEEEPSGSRTNKDASLSGLESSVRAILDWYDTNDTDLRECALRHPAFGLFDGTQWLLFAAVHMQQHRGQLLDLKLAAAS